MRKINLLKFSICLILACISLLNIYPIDHIHAQQSSGLKIEIIDLLGKSNYLVNQSYIIRIRFTNTSDTTINPDEFAMSFDPGKVVWLKGDNLTIFFDLQTKLNGKKLISHLQLGELIGDIKPGESKSFDFTFKTKTIVTNICHNSTLSYTSAKDSAIGVSSAKLCLNIVSNPPITDL